MLRKLALSLIAVGLLGAPAFAATKTATPPAKALQTTPAAKSVAVPTAKVRLSRARKHLLHRHTRLHRHIATMKAGSAKRL